MKIVIVGAGGHARSIIDVLRTCAHTYDPVACTDSDPELHNTKLDGVPVLGNDDLLPELLAEGITVACIGLGAAGRNRPRADLYARVAALGFELPAVAHASAHVAATATLGPATVVLAHAVVGPGARVGENVIVNTGAIVEHDCIVGNHAHLATACALGGAVEIADGAHIGLGAAVLQGRKVGAYALVGAGAAVIDNVGADETVIGCPAAVMEVSR